MEDVQGVYSAILIIAGVISALGGALGSFATIRSFLKSSITKIMEESIDEKIIKARKESESVTSANIEKVNTSVNDTQQAILQLTNQISELETEIKASSSLEKEQIIASSRYTINEAHKVCMKQGWIDSYTLSSLESIFSIYDSLGGNHFISDHMEDLRDLPNEKPKPQPKKRTSKSK